MYRNKYLNLSIFLFLVGWIICSNVMPAYGKGQAPKAVEKASIQQIILSAPQDPGLQNYLGVEKDSKFKLNQIRAKVLLLEILDVFCPDCQKNAFQMNRVYNVIETDSDLKSDVKIIGFAAGNDSKQIESFLAEFKVKFPVFPDPDKAIHKLLGGMGPPAVILADSNGKVLYVHEGVLDGIDLLLEKIRENRK